MNADIRTREAEAVPGSRTAAPVTPTPPATPTRVTALRRFALSITALTLLGHLFLGFEQAPITPVVCVLVAYTAEASFELLLAWSARTRPAFLNGGLRAAVDFFLPAHITALACAMLLYANERLWPYVLAVVIAITSKHLFTVPVNGRRKHYLNPSNLGIAVVLIAMPSVGIAPPYQFTASVSGPIDWLVPVGVLVLGTMLNAKLTGRWPLILGWVGGFVLQAAVRALVFDGSFAGALVPMTGVAFILFTNYMITDPATTPQSRRSQVLFGVVTALLYGTLVVSGVSFGLFFALVATCLLRGIGLQLIAIRARVAGRARVGTGATSIGAAPGGLMAATDVVGVGSRAVAADSASTMGEGMVARNTPGAAS